MGKPASDAPTALVPLVSMPVVNSPVGWGTEKPSTENLCPSAKSHQDPRRQPVPLARQPPQQTPSFCHLPRVRLGEKSSAPPQKACLDIPPCQRSPLPPFFATRWRNLSHWTSCPMTLPQGLSPEISIGSTSRLIALKARRTYDVQNILGPYQAPPKLQEHRLGSLHP